MRDRWDEEEDELDRGPARDSKQTLAEAIDGAVRKVVTAIVIAGGLIALGIYSSGDGGGSDLEYQIAASADGRTVYRINTDSGSIVACRDNHCWLMQRGSSDLEDEPPQENAAAPTSPAQIAPQQQPAPAQVAPAQPAPQLPAPTNQAAPVTR